MAGQSAEAAIALDASAIASLAGVDAKRPVLRGVVERGQLGGVIVGRCCQGESRPSARTSPSSVGSTNWWTDHQSTVRDSIAVTWHRRAGRRRPAIPWKPRRPRRRWSTWPHSTHFYRRCSVSHRETYERVAYPEYPYGDVDAGLVQVGAVVQSSAVGGRDPYNGRPVTVPRHRVEHLVFTFIGPHRPRPGHHMPGVACCGIAPGLLRNSSTSCFHRQGPVAGRAGRG